MNYSIIAIGDELLIGQVTDTNSGWIARHLTPYGWNVKSVKVVADDAAEIFRAIDEAFEQTDVILMTGGLGPTKDDITKPALCKYFGGSLVHDEATAANVLEVVAKRHIKLNDYTRAQAMVPSSCRVIQNQVGTAPIMWFEKGDKTLVSMPGVPHETETMMLREVIPQLIKKYESDIDIEYRTFIVIDIIESELAMRLDAFERSLPTYMHLAYLPQPGIIRLRLSGASASAKLVNADMDKYSQQLHALLGDNIISDQDRSLPEIVGDMLRKHHLTVSTAESCTGGNIAHVITQVAGSSDYFLGAVVSYANEVKENVLGVSSHDIAVNGVVSEPVVRQMVEGACRVIGTDCAVSTSGIAGPGGAVPGKPVGTVWMAAKCNDRVVAQCCHLPGDRNRVINRATTEALKMLYKLLRKLD